MLSNLKDGYIARERFTDVFKPDIANWVVLASDDNVIVADAINSVNSLSRFSLVCVFSLIIKGLLTIKLTILNWQN